MRIYLKEVRERYPEFEILNYDENLYFEDFNHDSRVEVKNSLFIPIIGEKFNGHDFIKDAFENGSVVSLYQKDMDTPSKEFKKPIIVVEDIQQGLGKILRLMRGKIDVPVIAITGSTGKTTTREMIAEILSERGRVLRSDRNFNTLWGNAQVLAKYDNHDFIVLEFGMDTKGEIKSQCDSLLPDIGILLNVGYVHALSLGGIDNVYLEKKQLAEYLISNKKPVLINIDDPRLSKITNPNDNLITFGKTKEANYFIKDISIDESGTYFTFLFNNQEYRVKLKIFGKGYAYNGISSIALAHQMGLTIEECIEALEEFNGFGGRFELSTINKDTIIINDAYNANPTSMEMALETYNSIWGKSERRKIVVLGDMKELGEVTEVKHRELGEYLANMNIDSIYYIGEYYKYLGIGTNCNSLDDIYEKIKFEIDKYPKAVVLFKASNSLGLESIIKRFNPPT